MNRNLGKYIACFFTACLLAVALPFGQLISFAATARISFSDPSAGVGEEFNVSVKITTKDGNLGAADVMLAYDPSVIEFVGGKNANGGAGSVRLVGTMDSDTTTVFSYNLKFKALQAGDTKISVSNYEVYDADTQAVEVDKVGASAVKVKAPSNYSKEASLASLKVSPGQLSPAFSADVTTYTVNVGSDVEKLRVSANPKDGKAKVVVSDCNLKTGANTVVCKVTAEDGQTVRSYTLNVNRSDSAEAAAGGGEAASGGDTQGAVLGTLKADIDGVEYSVAQSFDPAALPAGYTQSTCTYSGGEIMCGVGNGLTLIYLQDGAGNGGFYIYGQESGVLSPYVTIDVTAKSIVVLPVDETISVPKGLAETTIQLNGDRMVRGWVWQTDKEQKYCVIYGMNESGEKALYRYDNAEKTFQRYFEDPALKNSYDDEQVENLVKKYESLRKDYDIRFIIIVALILACLILFFIVVNLLLRRRDHHGGDDRRRREDSSTPVRRRAMQEEELARGREREARGQEYDHRRESSVRGSRGAAEVYHLENAVSHRGGISAESAWRVDREGRGVGRSSTESGRAYRAGDSRRQEEMAGRRVPPEQSRPDSSLRHSAQPDSRRPYREFDLRQSAAAEDSRQRARAERGRQGKPEEVLRRQRELEREERARRARERLERERLEDERRARAARMEHTQSRRGRRDEDNDFEFLDLD